MTVAPGAATIFMPAERDYIRRELDMFFSTYPTVAEGFQLKTWRGGPQAVQPKLSPSARTLLERGLMRLDATTRIPRLFFTADGLNGLRVMMADRGSRIQRSSPTCDRSSAWKAKCSEASNLLSTDGSDCGKIGRKLTGGF